MRRTTKHTAIALASTLMLFAPAVLAEAPEYGIEETLKAAKSRATHARQTGLVQMEAESDASLSVASTRCSGPRSDAATGSPASHPPAASPTANTSRQTRLSKSTSKLGIICCRSS